MRSATICVAFRFINAQAFKIGRAIIAALQYIEQPLILFFRQLNPDGLSHAHSFFPPLPQATSFQAECFGHP